MGKLTPISELPDTLENWGDIAWNLDAGAYIDTDRIGLDVGGMQRMMGCAGLKAATVRGYQGEQSEIRVNSTSVTGINPDGSATGSGSASVVKASTQRTSLEHQNENFAFRWPIATIGVNRAEIASRVGDDRRRKPDVPREVAWARHVDRALRSGIVDAAMKGLVKEPWADNRANIVVSDFLLGWAIYRGSYVGASIFWGFLQATPLIGQYLHDKIHPDHNHNWPPLKPSLFPDGFQPDRLAVTAIMAKTQRLVRPIG